MELDTKLRLWTRIKIALSQLEAPELRTDNWRWAVAHQRELLDVLPESAQHYLPFWNQGCTEQAGEAIPGELALILARTPGVGLNVRKAQESARICAAVQAVQTPSVHAFLTRRDAVARPPR
jgi:hypothetical protein